MQRSMMIWSPKNKQPIETVPEENRMLDLRDKEFKYVQRTNGNYV